jgi:hypothetical protein
MSENKPHYHFAGSAVGAAAQFHHLNDHDGLNYVVPSLGASALPTTGGLSRSTVEDFMFEVQHPLRRTLLSVRRVESLARGKETEEGVFATEVQSEIESLTVVEKLHIDLIKFHFLATRDVNKDETRITTKGNHIEGMWLRKIRAKIVLDDEPLRFCGSHDQLAQFYREQSPAYRKEHSHRFGADPDAPELTPAAKYQFSLVKSIELIGEEKDKVGIEVKGHKIIWPGFGKIILGEVLVRGHERLLTMIRLAMGSDAGGTGSTGSGQSNGAVGN